jgi:hypothetical protein
MNGASFAPDRWRRIEELFHQSIELPEEQRAAFLRDRCGADQGMIREIEALLAADDQESPLIAEEVRPARVLVMLALN